MDFLQRAGGFPTPLTPRHGGRDDSRNGQIEPQAARCPGFRGQHHFDVATTDHGGHIWVTVQRDDNVAVLRVRDTGVGISRERLPHVFDLFSQADRALNRSHRGLGFELALVKRVVEMHGGTVDATSEVGRGSEFVVRLSHAV